jgi:DNA-directed RNA polymerase specialized sigma24 family protein
MSGTIVMQLAAIPITAEGVLAFNTVWPELEPHVKQLARRLAPGDRDHQEELIEEAMIKLWGADPTRYNFRNPKHMVYMQRSLDHRMCDVWGRRAAGPPVTAAEVLGPDAGRAIRAELRSCT